MSRTSMLLPVSRPLVSSYPQRRDVQLLSAGSPLSPQSTAAFVLLPAGAPGLSRSSQSSRHLTGNIRTSGMLHSPPGTLHHYRSIQPKPTAPSVRYVTGPVSVQPTEVVVQPSRVTSDRRTSCPSFGGGGGSISWHGESSSVLNVLRVPAAAHGSRPLLAAHASSGGPVRGAAGGRASLSSLAALSLTIDDQAPLDCSRKSSGGDGVELDVPTVLNLTTSGQSGAASQGSSASPEHVFDTAIPVTSPEKNSTFEQLPIESVQPITIEPGGQHDTIMISSVIEDVESGTDEPRDIAVTSHDLEQASQLEMTTSNSTLNEPEDVKPDPAGLASCVDRPQDTAVTSVDLEQEGHRIETTVTDMTLSDLEEEAKPVPDGLATSNVAEASSERDLETTSNDLDNLSTEQHMETNVDELWKEEEESPAFEGFIFLFYSLHKIYIHQQWLM